MKALILTAGCSVRLRPLTDRSPKCLLTVGGAPILRRSVDNLRQMGLDELVVVTGYLGDMVRRSLTGWYPDLPIRFIDNPVYATTNNAYSLLAARPALDGHEFFLLDGDIVYDVEVVQLLAGHGPDCLALRTSGSIGLEEVKVAAGPDRRITGIGKEVPVFGAAGESVGIEYFAPATSSALFAVLHDRVAVKGGVNEYYEAAFQEMIDRGVALTAVDIGAHYAIEIDTREDLAAANEALLARPSRIDAAAV
jgi:choline kinase